ncbi:unnamed protein product [Eruca vesicaria subsp. sativa]|uniref:Uncharacterized protein n=1 Tax=Eruca vesicaria subsp. sativa TaxID=29727 RepID=A0ABC8LD45_ERUVS|nr:unnamed protein product [Eruca vesicaria subsp. sativa]
MPTGFSNYGSPYLTHPKKLNVGCCSIICHCHHCKSENSPVQTSDFSTGMNQNKCGFNDFTFVASNSNQLYNNNFDDHLIHTGSPDEQLLNAGNTTWMRMSNENLKQVINKQ